MLWYILINYYVSKKISLISIDFEKIILSERTYGWGKKKECSKVLTLGFNYAIQTFTTIIDYYELDLVNFNSIMKFFRYRFYKNLRTISYIAFIFCIVGIFFVSPDFYLIPFYISIIFFIVYSIFDFKMIRTFDYNENFYRKQKRIINRNMISIKILGNNKHINNDKIEEEIKLIEQKIYNFSQHKKDFIVILEQYGIIITILIPFISIIFEILRNPSILSTFFNLINYSEISYVTLIFITIVIQIAYGVGIRNMQKKRFLFYLDKIFLIEMFILSEILKLLKFPSKRTKKKEIQNIIEKLKKNRNYNKSEMKDLNDFFQEINQLDIKEFDWAHTAQWDHILILTEEKYNLLAYIEISSKIRQNAEKTFKILTKVLIEHYELP